MTDDPPDGGMSRRALLMGVAVSGIAHALSPITAEAEQPVLPSEKLKICIFSKHLQWADVKVAAAIARDIGFDGLDLTVRAGGHVLPERVEADLPEAVESIRRTGLEVPMITTDILSVETPHAEAILKTASRLGIRQYRWEMLRYQNDIGIEERLNQLKPQMRALADLNKKYRICGMYHTHAGPGLIGGLVWDLMILFQGLDPRWMAINYDIGHTTVEGGFGGWITSSRLVKDRMRGIALKDFAWAKNKTVATHSSLFDTSLDIKHARYIPDWCAIGDGMVNFPGFFSIVKENRFSGPVQLHFQSHAMGGAENGARTLTIPKETVISTMRKDLTRIQEIMRDQQLI